MLNILKNCLVFNGLNEIEISELIKNEKCEVRKFTKNQFIYPIDDDKVSEIGILIKGKVEIRKNDNGEKGMILNIATAAKIIGVSTISTKKDVKQSLLIAKEKTEILFIQERELYSIFSKDERVLKNYIKYTNDRIFFLNSKIEAFTKDSVRDKILFFLESERNLQGNEDYIYKRFSKTELAKYLSVSRPSLYRVFKELEDEGLIKESKETIRLQEEKENEK